MKFFPSFRPFLALLAVGAFLSSTGATVRAQTFYSHGDPSGDEQLFLEMVNRARANPPAEGARLGLAGEFAGYAARPPLVFNAGLIAAARKHNGDMIAGNFLAHEGSDGSTIASRIGGAGFPAPQATENVSFGFPGIEPSVNELMIDRGVPGLPHRRNFLEFDRSVAFEREVGIAFGGPRFHSTQDFGSRGVGFLGGVVYNASSPGAFYAPGQGVANVRVSSPASSFFTVTSASGGYSLPVDLLPAGGAQTVPVTFTRADGATRTQNVTFQPTNTTGSPLGGGFVEGAFLNAKLDQLDGLSGAPAGAASVSLTVTQPTAIAAIKQHGVVMFTRSGGDLNAPLTVTYTVKGPAIGGVDYKTLPGTLTIPAGSASAKVKVKTIDRADFPASLAMKIKLTAGSGYVAGAVKQAKVTLTSGR